MVFQKQAKKNSNLEFHIGKETIDIVHEYTYLGTRISSTGNVNISFILTRTLEREGSACSF